MTVMVVLVQFMAGAGHVHGYQTTSGGGYQTATGGVSGTNWQSPGVTAAYYMQPVSGVYLCAGFYPVV